MNLQEAVEYLFTRLPMFTRDGPRAFKKDLTNIKKLCDWLGNPHLKYKTIHVAGTNGKGSTSNMLAAILQQNGYKTGLYTSPHIKDFRERIRVDGQLCSEGFVVDFVERVKPKIAEIEPSYFEITVAMAFEYFALQNVDVAVIETGLGGVLDSTNIVEPVLSIITNIGIDHINILGGTLEKIATQKAGIIKPNTPVVIGEYLAETKQVFEQRATEMNAAIYFAQEMYAVDDVKNDGKFLSCEVTDKSNGNSERFDLDLRGLYQTKNLKTVLAAEKILIEKGFALTDENEKIALQNVQQSTGLEGRWQIMQNNPTVVLDVGHNEDGIKQLVAQLIQEFPKSNYHFVLGFVRDKEVNKVLELFPKDAKYYFTNAHIPRAMAVENLVAIAKEVGLGGEHFEHIDKALSAALANASSDDVVMVCGSFFTIAEISKGFFKSISA